MNASAPARDLCITGASLVSSVADGADEHWRSLQQPLSPVFAELGSAGYLTHTLPHIDLSVQITNPLELKRIGRTHGLGCYAAGRALDSAALKGKANVLSNAVVVVGGGCGERDGRIAASILSDPERFSDAPALNAELALRTRPSLFLAQLPNLLAGNISILFGICGGSRTMLGEEAAGFNAFRVACDLISDGTHELALVGTALNAERWDLLLVYGFGRFLWPHEYQPVRLRALRGGGTIFGSMAAFLVLETRDHALRRGVMPWCRVAGLAQRHSRRQPNDVANALDQMWDELGLRQTPPAAIISGASGVAPWTEEEASTLASLSVSGRGPRLRYSGSLFGHGMEASCLFNIGLGALALRHGRIYPPQAGDLADEYEIDSFDRLLVTSIGHYRGEAAAVLVHA